MRPAVIMCLGLFWLAAPSRATEALPLQPLLDAAAAGTVVQLTPGTYAGPIVISKPLILDGDGKAMIDLFVAGLAALFVLARAVTGRKLYWFAFYCWLAGLATILFVR